MGTHRMTIHGAGIGTRIRPAPNKPRPAPNKPRPAPITGRPVPSRPPVPLRLALSCPRRPVASRPAHPLSRSSKPCPARGVPSHPASSRPASSIAHENSQLLAQPAVNQFFAEGTRFELVVQNNPYGSLANCWFQPLTHPSGLKPGGRHKRRTAKIRIFSQFARQHVKKMFFCVKSLRFRNRYGFHQAGRV